MNKNNAVATIEEIQNISNGEALGIYFSHALDSLPRLVYDTQEYHRIEDDTLASALAKRVKEFVDDEWGGLKLESVGWVTRDWPTVRGLAAKHRRATFEAHVNEGIATKLYVGGLPTDASYQSILKGLGIDHPYDLMPSFQGNVCRSFAFVILPAATAEKLLENDPPKIVNGSPVEIRRAWKKR